MTTVSGSFRDPAGHVFTRGGRILRQVNRTYAPHYDRLTSGLAASLVDRGWLVAHREVPEAPDTGDAYRVIEPDRIPFISYPFEWSFSQMKAAAIATLTIQRAAVEHGMVLKDASAYNMQFVGAAPLLIDSLSFECWQEGTPWVAYRQFCQHFLGPLALMSATDPRLATLSRSFVDGAPLDLVSRLLPLSTRVHPSLLLHLHLHARAQARHQGTAIGRRPAASFTRRAMLGLVDHLQAAVERLAMPAAASAWADYYAHTNYSADAMAAKRRIVESHLRHLRPATVWDLGANTGAFSTLAADAGAYTVAFDADHATVDRHVIDRRRTADRRVLPLVMDLANPTGGFGWNHTERTSLAERGPADVVLALGLVHHLALAGQVPFGLVARFFERIGRTLVVEFIPPTDSQVEGMLSRMPSRAEGYSADAFEREFDRAFTIVERTPIPGSARRLYLMQSRSMNRAAA